MRRPTARNRSAESPGNGFTREAYASPTGTRHYKLFLPSGFEGRQLPLIVMLHGCKQDPDDFATGTRMNVVAQESGAIVMYPAQAPRSNAYKCWNWFQPADQRRGSGEPELLAAMTRQVMSSQPVDPERVYIAGMSAGGAMATIMGREYPDLFAAVGVHSGLPPGAAHDVQSAFAAMKNGAIGVPGEAVPVNADPGGAPVIVFHGDQDRTVNPSNGAQIIGMHVGATEKREEGMANGRAYTRCVIRSGQRGVRAEHWRLRGADHAWSGGSELGSYTDAEGPDASREMMRFFLEHPLKARA